MSKQRYYQSPVVSTFVEPPEFADTPVVGYVDLDEDPPDSLLAPNMPSAEELAKIRLRLDPNKSQYVRSAGKKWEEGTGKNGRILTPVTLLHHVCPHCFGFLTFGKRPDINIEECVDCCSVWRVTPDSFAGSWTFQFRTTSDRWDVVRVAARVARRRAGIE